MAKITKEFSAFGVRYRSTQFSAVAGFDILSREYELQPIDILVNTEVLSDGKGISLADESAINKHVFDKAGIVAPLMVLRGLMSLVHDFNFKFISDWSGAKIPVRFLDQAASISSKNVDPVIQQLVQDGVASLRELEEYYSLEDAFKLFDTIMVKGINQAMAQEATVKKSRR